MEVLLTNNIFFIYLLGILVIINYEAFEKRQKIAIIYVCSFGLTFNSDLRCVLIIALLLFMLFLYEEYLNKDLVKIKYVTRFKYKILDFGYMYIFQYKLLYIIIAIIINSNVCSMILKELLIKSAVLRSSIESVLIAISILLVIIGVHKIFNNSVELKTFKQINQKFTEYPYYHLPLKNVEKRELLFEKLELVADIEDYTFFSRKKSYSCCSLEFIKAVIKKKKGQGEDVEPKYGKRIICIWKRIRGILSWSSLVSLIKKRNKGKVLFSYISKSFIKVREYLGAKLSYAITRVKRYVRGYSTIEMQLIRILAYKKGLKMGKPRNWQDIYLVGTRKLFEVIYAPMFFSGHKKYINVSAENDFYRYYLVYIYLHTVQTNLNGRVFAPLDKIFGEVDVVDWPLEALFIIVLGLNNMKITRNRVEMYMSIINKYQLDVELIYQLIDCIQ